MTEKGGGDSGGETWKAAMVNLSEMGPNLDSMQKLLAKKAVFVDEETFAKGSLISEQARTIKVFAPLISRLLLDMYWSTLARDVPFAGLMSTYQYLFCHLQVTFYEALKDFTEYGKQRFLPNSSLHVGSSFEGLVLGGLAGGFSAYLTTPLDVIKTRLQVQGSTIRYRTQSEALKRICSRHAFCRYNGWLDALKRIWMAEGFNGMFRGSVPRIMWYVPASALTFMAVEFLRDHFNEKLDNEFNEVTSLSLDPSPNIQEAESCT
ncbi:hypothetical protein GW17_00045691 [Ensete ventricosum]|nr:hypothetical protein GW17_00045691 [Ensete ventricosum]